MFILPKRSSILKILLGLLLAAPLHSCSQNESEQDVSTSIEESPNVVDTYSSRFSAIMIETADTIVAVTNRTETIEQADAAEPIVKSSMERAERDLAALLEELDALVEADPKGPRSPSEVMLDSAVDRATLEADAAMASLEQRNPSAAIRLAYLAHEYGEEATRLVDLLTMRLEEMRGEEEIDDGYPSD